MAKVIKGRKRRLLQRKKAQNRDEWGIIERYRKGSFENWVPLILVFVCAVVGAEIGESYGVAHGWPQSMPHRFGGGHSTWGSGIGAVVGGGVGITIFMLLNIDGNLEKLRKKYASEREVDEKDREAGPVAIAERTVVQAKCKNCAKMLNCDTFEDDWRCCEKHEFFRGKQSQQRKGV